MIGDSNDRTNFWHKLLFTDTQVSKIRKAFANGSSANIKFSKAQLLKIIQPGGKDFLDKQIDWFNKEYVTGSRVTPTINGVNDIMKGIKYLENSLILLKGTTIESTSLEGGNFLRLLMTVGLPLMKKLVTAIANVLFTIWIVSRNDSSRCSYSKENWWITSSVGLIFAYCNINNFKWTNGGQKK